MRASGHDTCRDQPRPSSLTLRTVDERGRRAAPRTGQTRASCLKARWVSLLFIPAAMLGVAIQIWAASQWRVNFDSDEAIVGLMTRHILDGQIPLYFYGQRYLGSLDPLLSAPLVQLLGSGVPVLRLTALVWFALFLTLHAVLISAWWGRTTALLSLLILSVPGWRILTVTSKSSVSFGAMAVIGTSIVILAFLAQPSSRARRVARLVALGLLTGLGLWVHPMTIAYLVAVLIPLTLRLPEWRRLSRQFALKPRPSLDHSTAPRLGILAGPTLVLLVILAFFSDGCRESSLWSLWPRPAQLALALIAVTTAGALLIISTRRLALLGALGLAGVGFIVGNAPQWLGWLRGVPPSTARLPSCPVDLPERGRLLTNELLPALWGTPGLAGIRSASVPWLICWIAVLGLCLSAAVVFAWRHRADLDALITFSPASKRAVPAIVVAVMFLLPILLVLVNANAYEPRHTRYLVVTWQASSVIVALLLRQLLTMSRVAGLLALALIVLPVGISTLWEAPEHWAGEERHTSPEAVAALERYLDEQGVSGGFAGYWTAYVVDYLSDERLTFAPFGTDRYQPYTERVDAMPVQAYLFPIGLVASDVATGADLLPSVAVVEEGPPSQAIQDSLPLRVVVGYARIADWDVYLLAATSGANPEVDHADTD